MLADYYNGLKIFEVTDPKNPTLVSRIDTPGWMGYKTLSSVEIGGKIYALVGCIDKVL